MAEKDLHSNAGVVGSLAMIPALASRGRDPSPELHAIGELYQTSLMTALLEGVYEGDVTYGELHQHGDFGLGTFNDLDGEMVGFDGHFYQLRSDGSARLVTPEQKTPFAVVTFFKSSQMIEIRSPLAKADLQALIEHQTQANLFTAIRIDGLFSSMTTRTVARQQKPFPPLTEAAAHQQTTTLTHVRGTLAGFLTPAYAQGVGVAGFHLHFLREDRQAGGHALDYVIAEGRIELAPQHGFHVELPDTDQFQRADLNDPALGKDISKAEG